MDLQHHLGGFFLIHREELLQHEHDEIHRGEIVVEQDHLKTAGRTDLGAYRFKQGIAADMLVWCFISGHDL